jgi:hypothetical protein
VVVNEVPLPDRAVLQVCFCYLLRHSAFHLKHPLGRALLPLFLNMGSTVLPNWTRRLIMAKSVCTGTRSVMQVKTVFSECSNALFGSSIAALRNSLHVYNIWTELIM